MDVLDADTFPRHPVAFEALAGMSPAEFATLVSEVRPAFHAAEEARLDRPDRRRAAGAGRKPVLSLPDRVLLTLIKARFRAGWEVGLMFGVGPDTAKRTTRRVLPLLRPSSVAELPPHRRKEQFLRAVRCLPNHGGTVQLLGRACGLYIDEDGRAHPSDWAIAAAAVPDSNLAAGPR